MALDRHRYLIEPFQILLAESDFFVFHGVLLTILILYLMHPQDGFSS